MFSKTHSVQFFFVPKLNRLTEYLQIELTQWNSRKSDILVYKTLAKIVVLKSIVQFLFWLGNLNKNIASQRIHNVSAKEKKKETQQTEKVV